MTLTEAFSNNFRMMWMALPYTIAMTLTGLWVVVYLL